MTSFAAITKELVYIIPFLEGIPNLNSSWLMMEGKI
jgi:hypothetical protein